MCVEELIKHCLFFKNAVLERLMGMKKEDSRGEATMLQGANQMLCNVLERYKTGKWEAANGDQVATETGAITGGGVEDG